MRLINVGKFSSNHHNIIYNIVGIIMPTMSPLTFGNSKESWLLSGALAYDKKEAKATLLVALAYMSAIICSQSTNHMPTGADGTGNMVYLSYDL